MTMLQQHTMVYLSLGMQQLQTTLTSFKENFDLNLVNIFQFSMDGPFMIVRNKPNYQKLA